MAKSIKPWPEGATVRLLPQVSDGVEPYFHRHYVRKIVYEGAVQETKRERRIGGGIAAVADHSLWQDIDEAKEQSALEEEQDFERQRAQGHKLMAAALPPGVKVGVPSAVPPMDFTPDHNPCREIKISFTVEKFKVFEKDDCHGCGNKIVAALDAYYGKDARGSKHCTPCRRKMRID